MTSILVLVVDVAERRGDSWRQRWDSLVLRPSVPAAAAASDPAVPQLHSSQYRRPDDLPGDEVLVAAGQVRMPEQRVVGADGRVARLEDGTAVRSDAVLWCTGCAPVPGLHWIGLPWQTCPRSGTIDGNDRDAQALVRRLRNGGAEAPESASAPVTAGTPATAKDARVPGTSPDTAGEAT